MEIRKLPFLRPIRSKRAKFSAPPLLESRTGLPPESSAILGARLRASSAIFEVVPRTRTVSARCSPALSGEESASRSRTANVTGKGGPGCLAQETLTAASPGPKSIGGRTTRETGEDARTSAGWSDTETWLGSASPEKPRPRSSKRSVNEATRGTEAISSEGDAASEGGITAVVTRPGRPAMEAKRTPRVNGATKRALPVASVASLSPLEKLTVTPGVSRPLTSSTASVARSPETICRGSRRIRAPDAAGACCCGRANEQSCAITQIIPRNKPNRKKRRKGMRRIVVENVMTTCQPGGTPGHPEKRGTARDRSHRRVRRASEYRGRGRLESLVYRDGPKRIARRKCRRWSSSWPGWESDWNSNRTDTPCR